MALTRRAWISIVSIGVFIALVALMLIVAPPFAVRYATLHYLKASGVSARIGNVDANIFTGAIVYHNAHGHARAGDGFDIDRLKVSIAYLPLFSHRIKLNAIDARGTRIDIRRTANNAVRVAGMTVISAKPEKKARSSWRFGLGRLKLAAFTLAYSQPAMNGRPALKRALTFNNSNARDMLTWKPEQRVPLTANMGLGNDSTIQIKGHVSPFSPGVKGALELKTHRFALNLIAPLARRGRIQRLQGRIDSDIHIGLRYSDRRGLNVTLNGKMAWHDAALKAAGAGHAAADLLDWQGTINAALLQPKARPGQVKTNGRLTLRNLDAAQPGGLRLSPGVLRWQGRTRTRLAADATHASANGRLDAQKLHFTYAKTLSFNSQQAHWQGNAVLDSGRNPSRRLQGRVTAKQGRLTFPWTPLVLTAQDAGYSGFLKLAPHGRWGRSWLTIQGAPTFSGGAILQTAAGGAWAKADSGRAAKLSIDGLNRIKLSDVVADKLAVLQAPDGGNTVLSAGQAKADRVELDDLRHYRLGRLDIGDSTLEIHRNDQSLGVLSRFFGSGSNNNAKATDKSKDTRRAERTASTYAVDKLRLSGDRLLFHDTAVHPAATIRGSNFKLAIDHLDTASAEKKANYRLSADLGDYGHVDSTGRVAPLSADGLDMSVKATMRSLALGPLSGYMNAALGRGIKRGTADGDLNLGATNGALNGKLDVTLSNFQLANGQSKETSAALGVSLGTAIALIRSKDDTIDFTTNISGHPGAPSFSILNVVRQAIFAGLRKSVTSTYSPLGLIGDAVDSLSNLGDALSFHPVLFKAGDSTLTDEARQYLQQIGTAMSKQPGLSLTLTGHAVRADADSMSLFGGDTINADNRGKLQKLARKRAKALHDYLAARGIDPSRLDVAKAAVDPAKDARPRVRLSLAQQNE